MIHSVIRDNTMRTEANKDGARGKRGGVTAKAKAKAKPKVAKVGKPALVSLRRTRVVAVSLSADTVAAVDAMAKREGRNRSNFVDRVLRTYCGKEAA